MYLLKESQHEKRPDACLTLRKLFWLGCPGVILPIDRKTFITRKLRLSCLSTRDVQQSAGCASRISWPDGRRTVRSEVGLRRPGLPRHSQSEKAPEQSLMPQGTPAKAEHLGSCAHVVGPGRQEQSLPGPPTLSQQAVCCGACRRGGQTGYRPGVRKPYY